MRAPPQTIIKGIRSRACEMSVLYLLEALRAGVDVRFVISDTRLRRDCKMPMGRRLVYMRTLQLKDGRFAHNINIYSHRLYEVARDMRVKQGTRLCDLLSELLNCSLFPIITSNRELPPGSRQIRSVALVV